MIRILHCVAGLDRGGYETFIMNVFRNIDRTKIQFDFLYSYDGVYSQEIKELGGELYKIPFITQVGPIIYRNRVNEFFKQHPEYQIVHSHMDKFSGLIMECAKKNNVKVRIAHSHSTKNEGGLIYNVVKNYYGKKINLATDRFACSKEAGKWLFGKKQHFVIIKNGVDLNKFRIIDNRNKDELVLVNIGRFVEVKNHVLLLDIFLKVKELFPRSKLLLAGEGPLKEEIIKKSINLNLNDDVKFLGDVNDVAGLLARSDVFVMPSVFEGSPLTVVEAQAVGLNCVLSTGVSDETNVSNKIKYISIKESPTYWAKEIIKFTNKERNDNIQLIIDKGYDIKATTNYLSDYYIDKNILINNY